MSALHSGLICTLLFFSIVASLLCCMCAFRQKMYRTFAAAALLLISGALALTVLLAKMYLHLNCAPLPWCAFAGLWLPLGAAALCGQLRWSRKHVSQVSISESCDRLHTALCFAQRNGQPLLRNLKMDELSHQITGEALSNANHFWAGLAQQPVVTLADGHSWSFARTALEVGGQKIYQILGTDVTEQARLNRELEADNRRLGDVNRRLRQYSLDAQALAREQEALRVKIRLHDELGYVMLRTKSYLAGAQDDMGAICATWRQCIDLLRSDGVDAPRGGSYAELQSAARAIGVTIAIEGALPAEGTHPARAVATAIHESLTNLVRHAGGTRLEISGTRLENAWRVRFCNDGRPPEGPIIEGGGLSSLRREAETMGGTMTVAHSPRFMLTLILPEPMERMES